MEEKKEVLFYDIPNVTTKPVSTDEVKALYEMFGSQGWKTLMEIKQIDARYAAQMALTESLTDEQRKGYRIIYHACMRDLSMETCLTDALEEEKAIPFKDIEGAIARQDFDTIPLVGKAISFIGKFIYRKK